MGEELSICMPDALFITISIYNGPLEMGRDGIKYKNKYSRKGKPYEKNSCAPSSLKKINTSALA